MSRTIVVQDPRELARLIREDEDALRATVAAAVYEAAVVSTRLIRSRVPIDQGELRRSVRVEPTPSGGATVVYDAPYAAFQEAGTRPFTPPFDVILAWVMRQAPNMGLGDQLKSYKAAGRAVKKAVRAVAREGRAAERLAKKATRKRTTHEQAKAYMAESAARQAAAVSAASDVSAAKGRQDAAMKPLYARARAVWQSIRKNGIKAKWFERDSLPDRRRVLARLVARAVRQHMAANRAR